MKVLFTIDTLMGGGTETSTLQIIKSFDNSVDAAVCYFYPKHDLAEDYISAGIPLHFLNLPGTYSFFAGVVRMLKLVKQLKPDLLVTSLYRASVISRIVSLISGVPLVDTMVNDSYGINKRKEFNGLHIWKFRMIYLLDRLTAFIPSLWISNSQYLSRQMGKQLGIKPEKIKTLYRGRDINKIERWVPPAENSSFHFLSIGRLYRQKGQADLIQAFAHAKLFFPDTRLTICGEGPERENLEKLIDSLQLNEYVFLKGRVPDAWKELYTANCFVLPSYYEGFSGALVEAMITGIPVVVSDIPMNMEAVEHNVSGFVYKVGDVEDLAEQMKKVRTGYNTAISNSGKIRLDSINRYSIQVIARKYQRLLLGVLNNKT